MDPKTARDCSEFSKLYGDEGPITFNVGDVEINAWMRNLTAREYIHTGQLFAENYEAMRSKGVDEQGCKFAGGEALKIQTILYCVRAKKDGDALFSGPREVFQLKSTLRDMIYLEYCKRYELTEDEVGNSLRAKIVS
jgi:hypothetical protein